MVVCSDPYLTRRVDEPTIAERPDPVLHGGPEAPGPFTPEQLAQYDRDGYLFFPALFSGEEIQNSIDELQRLRMNPVTLNMCETVTELESNEVRSIFRVHETSDVFNTLARQPRLLDAARQILGSEVYVHQSRVNYKPGLKGKEFYWHSDFETWHAEDGMPRPRALSVSILLTENHPYNGPVMVIPGSHRSYIRCMGWQPKNHYQQSLKKQEYGVPDPVSLEVLVNNGGIEAPTGPAGSVLFFECNLMHGSNGNITPYPRSNVFFVYNSVENACVEPFYAEERRPEYIAARSFEPLKPLP
jgi:ectoine hydroxylase